jgi:hypothetical protein
MQPAEIVHPLNQNGAKGPELQCMQVATLSIQIYRFSRLLPEVEKSALGLYTLSVFHIHYAV